MTSKPKEVYKTIKRQISATAQAASLTSGFGGTGGARYFGYSGGKQWIHPPDVLTQGRVEYTVKMLGQTEVTKPKGTEVIREAIQKIKFRIEANKGIGGTSGSKLQKVDIQINVDSLTVADTKSRMILVRYPLHRISFCADDKHDKRVFSFIAKGESGGQHDCFVFLSDKLAEEITLTIGEAFDLAYQKFLNSNGRDLENKKQLILLRRRIAELEGENALLKRRVSLGGAVGGDGGTNAPAPPLSSSPLLDWEQFPVRSTAQDPTTTAATPQVPTSPIPAGPPANLQIRPPPMPGKRAHGSFDQPTGPEVGRRLENLQLDKMEDLFDDQFNPRASEGPKDVFGLDPFDTSFSASLVAGGISKDNRKQGDMEPTPHDFDQLMAKVDERIAEMREGFQHGLSTGDTGDDLLADFVTPSDQPQNKASASSNGHS